METNTESSTCLANRIVAMLGGNTNWRGPIWLPANILIIRALLNFYLYYGDAFRVEFPTGSQPRDEPVRYQQEYRPSPYWNFSAGPERETAGLRMPTTNFRTTRTGAIT